MIRPVPGSLVSVVAAALGSLAIVTASQAQALFRDVTRQAGITFEHHSAPEKKYIVESMSGGVALFDFDRDGLVDIYLVNSLTVETADNPKAARSALYRNLGGFKFEDVTDKAGVGYPGWGMGVCVADVDGDGWDDLYVTALGGNRLYRNQQNGTFRDVTAAWGVGASGWSTGCGFADYDRDGDLDLFVARYVSIDLEKLPPFGKDKTCEYRGTPVQCGPRGLPGETDLLFRNEGNGRFAEVGQKAGVSDPGRAFGMGLAWFDANGDGWPDLYVANDTMANFLYLNRKNGTFEEAGFPMGAAVSEDGSEQGSMGVALGDYTRTGRFSLFVTNYADEYNALYRHDGAHFTDVSFRSRTAASSQPLVGWGTSFFDYDNDGWLDLYVVNGHVYPQVDKARLGASAGYRQRSVLYRNLRNGTFEEVAPALAGPLALERANRGSAVGDLDNDGRLDIVINGLDGMPQVLRSEAPNPGNWLFVKLRGAGRNTNAIGAVLTVHTGKVAQQRLVQSGTSYLSQDDMRLHVGLGTAAQADVIEVRWADGTTTRREGVKANQIIEIVQPAPAAK
jgi:hypothetical protein